MRFVFKSGEYLSLYPTNSNSNFRNVLKYRIPVSQNACVALVEAYVPPCETINIAYLLCDVVTHTQIGNGNRRLLRILHINRSSTPQKLEFNPPIYVDLAVSELSELRFTIKTTDDVLLKFADSSETILHLQLNEPVYRRDASSGVRSGATGDQF